MKLQHKLFMVISTVILVVVGFVSLVFNLQSNALADTQMRSASMDMAQAIASNQMVAKALNDAKKDDSIQDLIQPLMTSTRYQYIIVMDMEGIQYSYPYESGLYKPYKNGGEKEVLLKGMPTVSLDTNELITAIRAFYPIEYSGKQVGAVLVGLLADTIHNENKVHLRTMEYTLVISIVIGLVAAFILSRNVKASIFGLEPKEIARMLTEKELIIDTIERGIVAINNEGITTMHNKKARELVGNERCSLENCRLEECVPELSKYIEEVRVTNNHIVNESCILNKNQKVLLNICGMYDGHHKPLGMLISIESLTDVKKLAEEITNYKALVDTLRSQNHEFMNKLQILSGLIQLNKLDDALDYIEAQTTMSSHIRHILNEHIREPQIAGLLLAKYEVMSERKIDFSFDHESDLEALPTNVSVEDVCTIVGNLLDNSMDALASSCHRRIELYIYGDEDGFMLEISNTGPAILEDVENIYSKGYTTKGDGRGYGMYLVKSIIDAVDGKIYLENGEEVVWHVFIKNNQNNDR